MRKLSLVLTGLALSSAAFAQSLNPPQQVRARVEEARKVLGL